MHPRERATLSLVFGALAVILPALMWVLMVRMALRGSPWFKDHWALDCCFTPLALVVGTACAVPGAVLAARETTSFGGREPWSKWRATAVVLSVLGLMLALGTWVGPLMLAQWLR